MTSMIDDYLVLTEPERVHEATTAVLETVFGLREENDETMCARFERLYWIGFKAGAEALVDEIRQARRAASRAESM